MFVGSELFQQQSDLHGDYEFASSLFASFVERDNTIGVVSRKDEKTRFGDFSRTFAVSADTSGSVRSRFGLSVATLVPSVIRAIGSALKAVEMKSSVIEPLGPWNLKSPV